MSVTFTPINTYYVNSYFPLGNNHIQCVAIKPEAIAILLHCQKQSTLLFPSLRCLLTATQYRQTTASTATAISDH